MSVDLKSQEVQQYFYRWMQGNQDAIRLLNQFCQLAREVDDLVDTEITSDNQDRVSTILELSLIHIPGNPLFGRLYGQMQSVIIEMITYWRISDEWRNSKDPKKQIFGFVWRESTDRLAVVLAGIIGGTDWAKTVAEEVYGLTHARSDETIQEWIGEEPIPDKEEPVDGSVREHSERT